MPTHPHRPRWAQGWAAPGSRWRYLTAEEKQKIKNKNTAATHTQTITHIQKHTMNITQVGKVIDEESKTFEKGKGYKKKLSVLHIKNIPKRTTN